MLKRNNNEKESKMSNFEKLIQTFIKRGHSWSNSVVLAKNALRQLSNGMVVTVGRIHARVDD
tara:strand:- start:405 stop:590 length:186 start_codon:yes stop_codon:yes gene_type:complete